MLLHRGQFLDSELRRERVTREEVFAAVRSEGYANIECLESVVLETDGTFSVVPQRNGTSGDRPGADAD